MKIGAIQKFSLIDYPGKVSAIVFTQGCNFRCPYCHNPELVLPEFYGACFPEEELFSFLEKRRGKLTAVSITGGEPTLQPDLIPFIVRVKEFGYSVKLDTNGSRPGVLRELLAERKLDFIAMDIKSPLARYSEVAGVNVNPDDIALSIKLVIESGIDHEFRTTFSKSLLNREDIQEILHALRGAKSYVLQRFVRTKTLDPNLPMDLSSESDLARIREQLETGIPIRIR